MRKIVSKMLLGMVLMIIAGAVFGSIDAAIGGMYIALDPSIIDGISIALPAGVGIYAFAAIPVIPAGMSMGEFIKQLRDERSVHLKKIKELTHKKELTPEEKEEFDRLDAKVTELDERITALEAEQSKVEDEIAAEENKKNRYKARFAGHGDVRTISAGDEKDLGKFSYTKFVRELMADKQGAKLTGIEKEMAQEASNEARKSGLTLEGAGIPTLILSRGITNKRSVVAGSATAGGNLVEAAPLNYIEALKEKLVLVQLGADFLTGLVGNIPFSNENAIAAAVWETEVAAADESVPTWAKREMKPKRLSTFIDYSIQMVHQDSISLQNRLVTQLVDAAAAALHRAAINGPASQTTIPIGILNTSGIGAVIIGDNGGAPTWAKVVELESKVSALNADIGTLGYLTNARVRGLLKTTAKDSGSGLFLMGDDMRMNGYNVGVTNLVPNTLSKGSKVGNLSALIFGNFDDLVIGQWGGLDIVVDPYTKARTGQVGLTMNGYYDVLLVRPQSFAACVEVDTGDPNVE